jgi:hypothetical protein
VNELFVNSAQLKAALAANPLLASASPTYGLTASCFPAPGSFWAGDPGSIFTLPRGGSPGQCVGCGAPGVVGGVCEYCGGKNIQ